MNVVPCMQSECIYIIRFLWLSVLIYGGFALDVFFQGEIESFDNSRKRKPLSTGWCRICKIDCETVDGLEIHSQTREHQQMAMDIVLSIKQQNAKKQKL